MIAYTTQIQAIADAASVFNSFRQVCLQCYTVYIVWVSNMFTIQS